MCVDFRQQVTSFQTIIKAQMVDSVEIYKYLGPLIDNKLCKKGQQYLFCLQKWSFLNLDRSLMALFFFFLHIFH